VINNMTDDPQAPWEDSTAPASVANMADTESRRFSKFGLSLNKIALATTPESRTKGHRFMAKHASISPEEAADRLAIRELVEAYAHCADRRDAKGQMALFTADTQFVVYMDAKDPKPSQELHSREELAPVFADLNQYAATMHFLGQTTILTLTRDRGTGETYCMPHHLTIDGKNRRLMIAALRYLDTFVKMDGAWLFAERKLFVDWLEQRELS
jgi:hypothetical protein